MVDDPALGIETTCSGAGILTLGVDTGKVRQTIRILEALGSASFVRVSNVVWWTGAGASAV
jgi:hypothetical protein